ncbi:MAG: beta-ketoacyl synthase N-terminal-like domain-containing protein [Proteobacteria bacterium]|nr:beta-ketoacyl synthase N-terminal-like domain-containing protein [Pseudomonadota bacterium]
MSIAIVSIGTRFPGASTLQEFWQHIMAGHDLVRAVAAERWPIPAEKLPKAGADGVLHDRVYHLDHTKESSFGLEIDAGLLANLDPLFHIALGAGRDAFFSCRHQHIDRQRCGVILGNIALPTESSAKLASDWLLQKLGQDPRSLELSSWNAYPAALPASVLARALGFGGGAFTLDAACASSLYAIKLACDALRSKQLDCVLAGGLSRPDSLYTQMGFTALQALSQGGRCYAFDARADGLLVGEGAGIFVLKRLEDAEAEGDTIWAVISGIGLANDRQGRLMAPSSEGQLRAMKMAYADAAWQPHEVQVIECHATGTPLGDRTEWETLRSLWAEAPAGAKCVLGSVKPNVGHMLTAAGAAGLAKLLIAMREGLVPPTAHFEKAPETWQLAQSPFRILTKAEAWPETKGVRRAAISGFGFGGINAHVLVESYQAKNQVIRKPAGIKRKAVLIAASSLGDQDRAWLKIAEKGDSIKCRRFAAATIPYSLLRMPPAELKEILPQQLYSLLALKNLSLPNLSDAVLEKTACFVGLELDASSNLFASRWALKARQEQFGDETQTLEDRVSPALNADRVIGALGSIVASRLAREANLGGPSFTVSAMENSGLKALELAVQSIEAGESPAALVLAADMLGSAVALSQLATTAALGNIEHKSLAESAIAILLVDAELAKAHAWPILAEIEAIGMLGTLSEDILSPSELLPVARVLSDKTTPSKLWAARGGAELLRAWQRMGYQSESVDAPYRGSAQALGLVMDSLHDQTWLAKESRQWLIKGQDRQLGWMRLQRGEAALRDHAWSGGAGINVPRRDLELNLSLKEAPDTGHASLEHRAPAAIFERLIELEKSVIASHEAFLRYRIEGDSLLASVLQHGPKEQNSEERRFAWVHQPLNKSPALYDYAACQEFARGSIAQVFGADFAAVDDFSCRVRLPDERLLLCHRVMHLEGEKRSLASGSMITEHDVFHDAWYLDDGLMPTSIAVEAGQADLMLSAWLGADFHAKGRAVYRLLDAKVKFHRALPRVGSIVRYAINIKRFFEQSGILFFHFGFEASVDGEALMSMTDGCAGFFTAEALAEGRGIKRSQIQLNPKAGRWTGGYQALVPVLHESYNEQQLEALRQGNYADCFGPAFSQIQLKRPKALPGGDMRLVHRIKSLEPGAGRYGLGRIIGEADIHADDWFLSCHFVDDPVMPGTLMYECCLHTLRIFLMRLGWVGERDDLNFEPMPSISSQLKCRGQVLTSTQQVSYEIEIKEMGYGPNPYVLADALMYADGKAIVDITDMSLYLPGLTQEYFSKLWSKRSSAPAYNERDILAFSSGKPSDCFGDSYQIFDSQRRIARLPRAPLQFLDRIEWVEGPYMKQHVGTELLASYDPPEQAWSWDAEATGSMPFAVLLEIALQPCGFMAAYMGSALLSEQDLSFRNLSGTATMHQSIRPGMGTLQTKVICTKISRSGGMIIQDYEFSVSNSLGLVYDGTTSFGYFTADALAQQIGLRHEARLLTEHRSELSYPIGQHCPRAPILMVDTWSHQAEGGRYGLGIVWGHKTVDENEWFFAAHFFQDPVMPGSLGLEAMLQTLKAAAAQLWPDVKAWRFQEKASHSWTYRGQVKPSSARLSYALHIKDVDAKTHRLLADGLLYCNGLAIYEIKGLAVEAV